VIGLIERLKCDAGEIKNEMTRDGMRRGDERKKKSSAISSLFNGADD
jgi:hypothetical protein